MFDEGDAIADRLDIEAACKKLTSKQAQVLNMWLLGYTQEEAAASMGITQVAVCRLIDRAAKTIRAALLLL
jgi:DNA-directed RNA polymerase specialized sigma24 family protein